MSSRIFIVFAAIAVVGACTSPQKVKQAYNRGYNVGFSAAEQRLTQEVEDVEQRLRLQQEQTARFQNNYVKLRRTVKRFFDKRECLIFRENNNGDVALAENNVCRALGR